MLMLFLLKKTLVKIKSRPLFRALCMKFILKENGVSYSLKGAEFGKINTSFKIKKLKINDNGVTHKQ